MKLKNILATLFLLMLVVQFPLTAFSQQSLSSKVFFIELMPNPEGQDKGSEWIKLKNASDQIINLEGWSIVNKKHELLNSSHTINPNSEIVIYPQKITLTNKSDTLTLLDPLGNTIDMISYSSAPSGQSLLLKNNRWSFSDEVNQNIENASSSHPDEQSAKTLNATAKRQNSASYLLPLGIAVIIVLLIGVKPKSAPS